MNFRDVYRTIPPLLRAAHPNARIKALKCRYCPEPALGCAPLWSASLTAIVTAGNTQTRHCCSSDGSSAEEAIRSLLEATRRHVERVRGAEFLHLAETLIHERMTPHALDDVDLHRAVCAWAKAAGAAQPAPT